MTFAGAATQTVETALPLVWVVDDDGAIRESLDRLLSAMAFKVEAFASAQEALKALDSVQPCCVIADLVMPGLSGLDLLHALSERGEQIPVVFLSGAADVARCVQAMKDGAIDFIEKPADCDALVRAVIRGISAGTARQQRRRMTDAAQLLVEELTPREREVMLKVASGLPNKVIAAELGVSIRTIKVHRGRTMKKLQAGSVVDLLHIAEQAGALPR